MGVGVVNLTSNIDSRLSELFGYLNAWILEMAKGIGKSRLDCSADMHHSCIYMYLMLRRTLWISKFFLTITMARCICNSSLYGILCMFACYMYMLNLTDNMHWFWRMLCAGFIYIYLHAVCMFHVTCKDLGHFLCMLLHVTYHIAGKYWRELNLAVGP